jgi:hypothetical protein
MSKLIQCLFDCFSPPNPHRQPVFNTSDLTAEAYRIYQASADQARYQRRSLTHPHQAMHQAIVTGITARVTSELERLDLARPEVSTAFWRMITRWQTAAYPHTQACHTVKKALLAELTAVQKMQQLRALCRDYKAHLSLEIESQLYNDHDDLYGQYQFCPAPAENKRSTLDASANRTRSSNPALDQFVQTRLASHTLPDSDLKKTVIKYEAVIALEKTLQKPKPIAMRVQDFQQAFQQQKLALEKHRDSWGVRFLKGVAAVFTLGVAACLFGVFSVKGAEVAEKMQTVLEPPIGATPTSG